MTYHPHPPQTATLRPPERIEALLTAAADHYGLAVPARRALSRHPGGDWVEPEAAASVCRAWARALARHTDAEIRDGLESLVRRGERYLDLPALAGACAEASAADGGRSATEARASRVCARGYCDGSGALDVRLPLAPSVPGAASRGLVWVSCRCACAAAPRAWVEGAAPTGDAGRQAAGLLRGLALASEVLRDWAEGGALHQHALLVETLPDEPHIGVGLSRRLVADLRRDRDREASPERLAEIEAQIATLDACAAARSSPRVAALQVLAQQLRLAEALGARVPLWAWGVVAGVEMHPDGSPVAP